MAVIGAYIAESQTATSGAHAGLGHEINADLTALQTPRAYAAAVVLFALAIACFYALTLAERRLAPWAPDREETLTLSTPPPGTHRVARARPLLAACRRLPLALSACGAKQDVISAPAHEALHA